VLAIILIKEVFLFFLLGRLSLSLLDLLMSDLTPGALAAATYKSRKTLL
jgi:hypothetical protein